MTCVVPVRLALFLYGVTLGPSISNPIQIWPSCCFYVPRNVKAARGSDLNWIILSSVSRVYNTYIVSMTKTIKATSWDSQHWSSPLSLHAPSPCVSPYDLDERNLGHIVHNEAVWFSGALCLYVLVNPCGFGILCRRCHRRMGGAEKKMEIPSERIFR